MSQRLPGECVMGLINPNDRRRYSLALYESIGMGLGSQVVVQVTQTGSVTPIIALLATRYLSLQNGSLKIVGV
jgi:hypothetical protein